MYKRQVSRNPCSPTCTTLSSSLARNGRLDTGRKFFRSPASSPTFFNDGRTRACLNAVGKQADISDLLNNSVMNGDRRPRISFTSHVGAGSSSHVLFRADALDIGGQVSTGIVVAEIHVESDQPPGTDDDTTSTSRQPSATAAAARLPPEGPS